MTGDYLARFWRIAIRRGLEPLLVVRFGNGMRAEIRISRDVP